ncbi:MAG: hypothetical protein JXA20_05545 [Spirochaetes bacterium]|nr:hypothetical protein [Spirochaetota bacterium]
MKLLMGKIVYWAGIRAAKISFVLVEKGLELRREGGDKTLKPLAAA